MKKTCTSCGEDMPLTEFYSRSAKCKPCYCRAVRAYRRSNESVREYDRARAKTPMRRKRSAAIAKRWREENPAAYKAQTAVGNALRDGKIAREPCAICETDMHVHAHHKDYAKPLDVVWLCAKCHHRIHALFPELEGANKQGVNA